MTEEKTDWKIQVTLDRDAVVEDIVRLVKILKRQQVYCVVSASTREEAVEKAKVHMWQYGGIPTVYLKTMHPRRLPT